MPVLNPALKPALKPVFQQPKRPRSPDAAGAVATAKRPRNDAAAMTLDKLSQPAQERWVSDRSETQPPPRCFDDPRPALMPALTPALPVFPVSICMQVRCRVYAPPSHELTRRHNVSCPRRHNCYNSCRSTRSQPRRPRSRGSCVSAPAALPLTRR